MTTFEVTGWAPPRIIDGTEKLLLLIDSLTSGSAEFSLEAHFKTVEDMEALAEVLQSPLFSCYCWSTISEPQDLQRPEFSRLGEATFLFERYELSLSSRPSMPAYDWDGRPSELVNIALIDTRTPLSAPDAAALRQSTSVALQEALYAAVGHNLHAEVSNMNMTCDGRVCERYLVQVPAAATSDYLLRLMVHFQLKKGVGSYEFLGTADQVCAIYRDGRYAFAQFPRGCRSFNGSSGKTPFAIGRASYRFPLLNIPRNQCPTAARLLDKVGDRIETCYLTRRYLQWTLGAGRFSPKTQGNFAMLSKQPTGCLIFVGIDQYADSDPSVKRVSSTMLPILKGLGVNLKRVPYYR